MKHTCYKKSVNDHTQFIYSFNKDPFFSSKNEWNDYQKWNKYETSAVGYLTQDGGSADAHQCAPQTSAWLIRRQALEDTVFWSL